MPALTEYLDPQIVRQVQRLDLRARVIVEGFLAGLHRSPLQGLSVEFSEHRKYARGDDLRTIDWNVFGRTDRLYVRKYQAETHLHCHLLVDASASMGPVGETTNDDITKLEYAIYLAAALGYLVVNQQDSVGLGIIQDKLRTLLPPRARRADLLHLLSTLSRTKPHRNTGLAAGIIDALHRIPHRGLVVVLSDLLAQQDELRQAFHAVRFRGHDLIVMHVLDVAEAELNLRGHVRLVDPETGAQCTTDADGARARYREAVLGWQNHWRRELAALRADYVPLHTAMKFDRALVEFLQQRARRQ